MGDEVRVDPQQLVSAATGFDELSGRVREAWKALEAALGAEGASWGSDAPGTTFAAQYVPGRDAATAAVHGLADTLAGIAAGLRDTATAFDDADTGFAGALGGGA